MLPRSEPAGRRAVRTDARRSAALRAAGWTLLAMTLTALGVFVLG
jgi:hypothetical protein